tara:strand:+ start:50 stop:550 length:501 start_codon:yes stop_codon:yes gene_type:complete
MTDKIVKHKIDWTKNSPIQLTYKVWRGMIFRCTNPKSNGYHNYGGRGIKVCDRWLNSFDSFVDDLGIKPDGKTLERIDVNGNYEPENVTWATYLEQANNRRHKEDAGLHFFKRKQTWQVTIGIFGKTVYLGSSKTKKGAIKIRKAGETIKNLLIELGVYKDEHIDV